jgi:hypothetical protein
LVKAIADALVALGTTRPGSGRRGSVRPDQVGRAPRSGGLLGHPLGSLDGDLVESWIERLHRQITAAQPRGRRQDAYSQWFDEEAVRRDGRRGRLAEASPFVPLPLWLVLGLGAAL